MDANREFWPLVINAICLTASLEVAHCSYEAGILEDPDITPPKDMWTMTKDPEDAPNQPTDIMVHFEKGIPTKVVTPDGTFTDSV